MNYINKKNYLNNYFQMNLAPNCRICFINLLFKSKYYYSLSHFTVYTVNKVQFTLHVS